MHREQRKRKATDRDNERQTENRREWEIDRERMKERHAEEIVFCMNTYSHQFHCYPERCMVI